MWGLEHPDLGTCRGSWNPPPGVPRDNLSFLGSQVICGCSTACPSHHVVQGSVLRSANSSSAALSIFRRGYRTHFSSHPLTRHLKMNMEKRQRQIYFPPSEERFPSSNKNPRREAKHTRLPKLPRRPWDLRLHGARPVSRLQ